MDRRLPLALEHLRIATPCSADWDQMSGDERVRFCGKCEKNVYNLSAMTRAEAEALVREKDGRTCVRLYKRRDGTVLTSDCSVGVRRQRLRARVWASVSAAAASTALLFGLLGGRGARADLAVAQGNKGTKPAPPMVHVQGGLAPQPLMGRIALPEPKPHRPEPVMGEPVMGDVAVSK